MGACSSAQSKNKILKDHNSSSLLARSQSRTQKFSNKTAPESFACVQEKEVKSALIINTKKTEQEIRQIINSLKKHSIFSSLKQEYKSIVLHHMKLFALNKREIVFQQGMPGQNFYIVESGLLEVIVNQHQVNLLNPGDSFGELALIHNTLRTGTVRTIEKSRLWGLDKKTFRKTLELIESVNYQENKHFIETIPIFETLEVRQKECLIHSFSTQYFKPDEKIVKEGEPGELMYVIKEGNVICTRSGQEIRKMGKGDYFGEQAVLYNEFRTATITAIDNVKTIVISKGKLAEVMGDKLVSMIYQNSMRIALENDEFMKKLNKEQVNVLINNMEVSSYENGSVVIYAGLEKAHVMWIVLKGKLVSPTHDIVASVFDILGAESMTRFVEGVYEDDIYAAENTDVVMIHQKQFESLLNGEYSDLASRNEALKLLHSASILRSIDMVTLEALFNVISEESFENGDVVFSQNDLGDSFYIVKSGAVDAYKDGILIRSIIKGDYFGERSLMLNEFRSATVKANGKVTCWKLMRTHFMELIQESIRVQLLKRIEMQDDSIKLNDLCIVKHLGSGLHTQVHLAAHKEKKKLLALKTVKRQKINDFGLFESVLLEKNVLMQIDHIFIMKLIKTFKDENRLYFLIEYINGISLKEVMKKMKIVMEADSKFYIGCLVDILLYLHDRDIIYRDLNPENIFIDEFGYPKLIDFGLAKFIKGRTYSKVGNPYYTAPEVILGNGYDFCSDYWSLGIILYELLIGTVPFGEENENAQSIYEKITSSDLIFPNYFDRHLNSNNLITQLLSKIPHNRIIGGYHNLKTHPWFTGFDWDKLISKSIKPPFIPQVKHLGDFEAITKNCQELEEALQLKELDPPANLPKIARKKLTDNWDKDF